MKEIIYFLDILLAIKLINITAKKVHARQNNFFRFNIKLGVKAEVFPSFPGWDKSVHQPNKCKKVTYNLTYTTSSKAINFTWLIYMHGHFNLHLH